MASVMGPGGTTSDGHALGTPASAGGQGGGCGRRFLADSERELEVERLRQKVWNLEAQLSSCGIFTLAQEPRESAGGADGSPATGAFDLQSRRQLQKANSDPQAVYHDAADGSAKLCPIHLCDPNPCLNGGVCTPSGTFVAVGGEPAGFACACGQGWSGLTCDAGVGVFAVGANV